MDGCTDGWILKKLTTQWKPLNNSNRMTTNICELQWLCYHTNSSSTSSCLLVFACESMQFLTFQNRLLDVKGIKVALSTFEQNHLRLGMKTFTGLLSHDVRTHVFKILNRSLETSTRLNLNWLIRLLGCGLQCVQQCHKAKFPFCWSLPFIAEVPIWRTTRMWNGETIKNLKIAYRQMQIKYS